MHKQLARGELTTGYKPQIMPRTSRLFKTEPTIKFAENAQQNHTAMELYTHDRPGLVSAVAQVLVAQNLQLINAKLTTLGDQVEDVFFITNNDDNALDEIEQQQLLDQLKDKLMQQAEQQATAVAF